MPSLNQKYAPTERQQAILDHREGVLAVLAGPGTGKTYGLVRRVESLVSGGRPAAEIGYVTFIREIVGKFLLDLDGYYRRERKEAAPPIQAMTLHSLAWRILRNLGHHISLPADIEVLDIGSADSLLGRLVLKDIGAALHARGLRLTRTRLRQVYREYARARQQLTDLGRLSAHARAFTEILGTLGVELQCVDWDSVIPLTLDAVGKAGEYPEWLGSIKQFLADEYQDFNPAESAFFTSFASRADASVLVGDPFQSIYSGRSASPDGFSQLGSSDGIASVSLVECRRCPSPVINAANGVLRELAGDGYMAARLMPFDPDKVGRSTIVELRSAKDEVELLAHTIRGWRQQSEADGKQGFEEIIGLFADWSLARAYGRWLEEAGIPCEVKKKEPNEAHEWLKLGIKLTKLPDHPLYQRSVFSRFAKLEARYSRDIGPILAAGRTTPIHAAEAASKANKWTKSRLAQLSDAQRLLARLRGNRDEEVLEALRELSGLPLTGASDWCRNFLSSPLETSAEEFALRALDGLASSSKDAGGGNDGGEPHLVLMTMHSAKGLDRRYVFMPGLEEAVFPGFAKPEELPEKRRLFYVALTRAKEELLITYPRTRDRSRTVRRAAGGRGELSTFAELTKCPVSRPTRR